MMRRIFLALALLWALCPLSASANLLQSSGSGLPLISSVTCGPSCVMYGRGGSATIGTVAVTASGTFTGTLSLQFSGTDHSGTTCDTHSTYFSISGTTLSNTASAVAGTYNVCVVATQAGITNSPYVQAIRVPGWVAEDSSTFGGGYFGTVRAVGTTLHVVYGDGSNLFYRQSTNEGSTWSSQQTIAAGVVTPTQALSVSGTNLLAIYLSSGDIFAVFSSNGGTSWGSACKLTNVGNVYRISTDASGSRFDVVWSANGSTGSPIGYTQTSTPGTCGSWSSPVNIGGTLADRPVVASSGSFVHVVWEASDNPSRPPSCFGVTGGCVDDYYVRSTNGGSSFEAVQHIVNYGQEQVIGRPAVAVLPSTPSTVVVWFHQLDPNDLSDQPQRIYTINSTTNGSANSWSSQIRVDTNQFTDNHPYVSAIGNTAIAFPSNTNIDLNPQFTYPWISTSTDGGNTWTAPTQASAQNMYSAAVAATTNWIEVLYAPFSGGPLTFSRLSR